jgi:DNA-binding transcriptional MerR regulator
MRLFKVSEAARQLERSERWLRESETKGKIPKARRDLNGWRVYTEDDIKAIRQLILPRLDMREVTMT